MDSKKQLALTAVDYALKYIASGDVGYDEFVFITVDSTSDDGLMIASIVHRNSDVFALHTAALAPDIRQNLLTLPPCQVGVLVSVDELPVALRVSRP